MLKVYENHEIEKRLYQEGYQLIAGTDEVGRGPLAGPVVAAAVIMPKDCYIDGVTDSKQVSEANRIKLAKIIKEKAIDYKIVFIDEATIDKINILESSRLAMTIALNSLNPKPDYILTDAMKIDTDIPYESIIHGDANSFTIACASIIAKVARDNFMDHLDEVYPEYGFKLHKGYPTKVHLEALRKYGVLPIHRKCYSPVKKEIEKSNYNLKYSRKK